MTKPPRNLTIAANYFKRKKLVGEKAIAQRTQLAKQKTAATRKSNSFMKKKLAAIEEDMKRRRQDGH